MSSLAQIKIMEFWYKFGGGFVGSIAICCFSIGCARAPIKDSSQAMRPCAKPIEISDDLKLEDFWKSLNDNVEFMDTHVADEFIFRFGETTFPKSEYLRAMKKLMAFGKSNPTEASLNEYMRENFRCYEVYGGKGWGEVFLTSYFEPVIDGSRKPDQQYSQPIRARPKDMIVVDIKSFANAHPEFEDVINEQSAFWGRLLAGSDGIERVVAFPDRRGIDQEPLQGSEILAWADPIDVFFLEIQGSGQILFRDGTSMVVGYAGQNGYPYEPIGRHLFDVIPKEEMTLVKIESYLRSLTREQAKELMYLNRSYIFFKKLAKSGQTMLGTEVVSGRTIATDRSLFPKGALAWLEFSKPIFADAKDTEPESWQKVSRFVFDQDTGGAIRGPGRVDLFLGRGLAAKQSAGVIKGSARLTYFVPIQ